MTDVACFAARTGAVACVTMTSTLSRTNSAAISPARSARPSNQRYSIAILRPSIQPSSRSRCTKAAVHWLAAEEFQLFAAQTLPAGSITFTGAAWGGYQEIEGVPPGG
jgi:hypothetical protein